MSNKQMKEAITMLIPANTFKCIYSVSLTDIKAFKFREVTGRYKIYLKFFIKNPKKPKTEGKSIRLNLEFYQNVRVIHEAIKLITISESTVKLIKIICSGLLTSPNTMMSFKI